MHIAKIPNRNARPSYLLRETYREDGKVKNRTLANLSKLPVERIETLRAALRGDPLAPIGDNGFEIRRSLPHGHVLAALTTARRTSLDDLLPRRAPQRRRDLALALIVARLLDPAAKLATARMLDSATASHSLGEMLGLGSVTAREVYATLDWLGAEQTFIENQLARRHLKNGTLVLYDVTSTYLAGRCCPLAHHGYSRDNRSDRAQLVIGLLCAADGCPVAVEVFEGNTADPSTVAAQVTKLKQRFRLRHVVMVGDRGMLTSARLEQTLRPAGLDWITALRGPAIRHLAVEGGPLQLSLFDTRDMAEITSPDYPGERLVVCRNPLLAEERRRKRDELLALTEVDLRKIQARVVREKNPLRGAGEIGKAVGAVLGKRKMAKHFALTITDAVFDFTRKAEAIVEGWAAKRINRFDGFYVLRTSLPAEQIDPAGTVRAYKSLAQVEQAFRCLKTVDLDLRPVFHWTAPRVRAHVLLCMLAYYLEWHMRQPLAPILFDDQGGQAAEAERASPVAKAKVSNAAYRKASTQRVDGHDGGSYPVHSFRTLLADLATLTRNTVCFAGQKMLTVQTTATPLQRQALSLLAIELAAT
ncbi:MAG: IS1634 family transposase [Sinobacteraceae bacterium]|nr:IS1634 family transposase [Nevskiaceae bacterium]MBV9912043.1 IS1634 family transposase [Nevskiaceae bacterium]